ncbi:MAG: hypothetical protein E7269_00405 [Lachnospiraceae bacterium]|nr:hypothetical protein [Lachnospiraceae bacterium]
MWKIKYNVVNEQCNVVEGKVQVIDCEEMGCRGNEDEDYECTLMISDITLETINMFNEDVFQVFPERWQRVLEVSIR